MATRDPHQVLFIQGAGALAPGAVELHRSKGDELARSLEEVKGDWNIITMQVAEIVSSTHSGLESEAGFGVDQIEISLGFSAKGKLAFIAEAGVEASIKLTLKRSEK